MLVAVGLYFGLRNVVGSGEIGWICVLAAFPFALCGFFTYNGMTFEKFLLAVIRSELLCPRKLVFRAENLYCFRRSTLIGLSDFLHNVSRDRINGIRHIESGKVHRFQSSGYDIQLIFRR